jgi:hypothetical protein
MNNLIRFIRSVARPCVQAVIWIGVGATIAAAVGVWAGLWFGGYQALKSGDTARFWNGLTYCVAIGAVTGLLARVADGMNPFANDTSKERLTDTLPQVAGRLSVQGAVRMRLGRLFGSVTHGVRR